MEITEVRIKLMEEASERLQAFCSITFDNSFVIRDLKIIDGANGPFVAMPSRKLTAHCPALRLQEPPARRALQPVRRPAGGRAAGQGRGRPGQALRRHRASDQLGLPRDDSGPRDPRVPFGDRSARSCPATSRRYDDYDHEDALSVELGKSRGDPRKDARATGRASAAQAAQAAVAPCGRRCHAT